MISRNEKILDRIRVEALEREIPEPDVDRWLDLVRPCGLLSSDGDGPVVGRFGGLAPLPADVEPPRYPLVAAIDCAALPHGATDLALPSDGSLLFFGYPEGRSTGAVILLGGYGTECNGSRPTEIAAGTPADDWLLLAEFEVYRSGGGATVFWMIKRDDLAVHAFDRVEVFLDWNP